MAVEPTPPTDDQIRAKLGELKLELNPEIKYRLPNLFPKLEGWFASVPIKAKAKLIQQLEPRLEEMLNPGEQVLFIAKGVQQSFFESLFMGALWASMINQTAFVLTNARMLMMNTNSKGKPKHMFWMIYYSEIETFKCSWVTGAMKLKLDDGRKMAFSGFPKVDRKMMVEVFEEAVDEYRETGFEPTSTQSMENLCSHCYDVVPKGEFECEGCEATYWKPSELAIRSLIFPSWGDFLMGHYLLATFELLGYFIGLMIVGFSAILALNKFEPNSELSDLFLLRPCGRCCCDLFCR